MPDTIGGLAAGVNVQIICRPAPGTSTCTPSRKARNWPKPWLEHIEAYNATLAGILPKAYRGFEPRLLMDLLKTFNRDTLKNPSGDVFGKIYEYFLNKFAQTGAQEGGSSSSPA